jgi:putative sterol carrier protein
MAQRVKSAQEVFEAMEGRDLPADAGNLMATIQFDLSGEGGGEWYVTIANRKAAVQQGVTANPTVTFSASAKDYLAIVNGDLNPVNAFMQGKVRVKGDMGLVMKLQSLFGK